MTEYEDGTQKPKNRRHPARQIKGCLLNLYTVGITLAFLHLLIASHSPSYREWVVEVEEAVHDIEIEMPVFNATPTPIYFSSEEHGGQAFLPTFVLEPGWYRYQEHNLPGSVDFPECGLRNLFADPIGRFHVKDACEVRMTVFGMRHERWSLKIERDS